MREGGDVDVRSPVYFFDGPKPLNLKGLPRPGSGLASTFRVEVCVGARGGRVAIF